MLKNIKTFAKGGIATATVGAMALAGAAPVQAGDRHRDRDGISVGDVIAGAVIIGGIAAIADAASKKRDRDYYRDGRYYRDGQYYRDGRDYRDRHYRTRGIPRAAVERCVRAAQKDARRYGGYRWARVTDIRDVQDTRYGWRIKGRIAVDGERRGRYDRYDRYDRNDRYDRYDRYDRHDRYDRRDGGKFTCYIERGRVTDVNFKGIRGLR